MLAAARRSPHGHHRQRWHGSLAHLTTIVLNQAAGVQLVPVPYKGGGPLSTDLMGGQVELGLASTAAQAQHVRGGKMRALVLTGDKRSHTMPDVPTLKEQGVDVVAHAWWGILGPAGTPRPIIDRLHAELVRAIKLPDVNKMLTETQGMDVVTLSPEATQYGSRKHGAGASVRTTLPRRVALLPFVPAAAIPTRRTGCRVLTGIFAFLRQDYLELSRFSRALASGRHPVGIKMAGGHFVDLIWRERCWFARRADRGSLLIISASSSTSDA